LYLQFGLAGHAALGKRWAKGEIETLLLLCVGKILRYCYAMVGRFAEFRMALLLF
jgi:hypothetical protein